MFNDNKLLITHLGLLLKVTGIQYRVLHKARAPEFRLKIKVAKIGPTYPMHPGCVLGLHFIHSHECSGPGLVQCYSRACLAAGHARSSVPETYQADSANVILPGVSFECWILFVASQTLTYMLQEWR